MSRLIRVPYPSIVPVVYLLRDEFTTDAVAPLTSPRTAEPGPGTLTLVQTDGQFSISGGKLVFPAQTTPAFGDQGLYGAALSRKAGRALMASVQKNSATTTYGPILGWAATTPVHYTSLDGFGIYFQASANLSALSAALIQVFIGLYASGVGYSVAVIQRGAGEYLFAIGEIFTNWTLLWVGNAGSAANLYPMAINYNATGTLDSFRVTDLPAPWDDDYGIATTRLAGARAAGDIGTQEANALVEYTVTTRPSAGNADVVFRKQDANNYWIARVTSAGALSLQEVVAGTPTQRGVAAGVVSNGHRVVIVADGTTIKGYSNNVLRWTYSSATNFQTATGIEVSSLGTGGAVSDLIAWPRVISGAALATLNAV